MTDRYPEIEIARLIQKRHDFVPGSDLLELVKQYAEVEFLPIPVDKVDGVSLHLKVKGRRPSIIVNSHTPKTRAQFTLAHEFGHVLIPWHRGTIFSFTASGRHTEGADMAYWEMEAEANRFAAELLMPQEWLRSIHEEIGNPAHTAKKVLNLCGTSMQAVVIAVNNSLPPGYVYASLDSTGHVVSAASSKGTLVSPPEPGTFFDDSSQFNECKDCFAYDFKNVRHNWLSFEAEQDFEMIVDVRPWREILDEIVAATGSESIQGNIKASLNAIVASSNRSDYSPNAFYASVRQKLAGRGLPYENILKHPLFDSYLVKRIEDLISRRQG